MSRVDNAIETGRCALAVSGSLLRDPDVMLALSNRAALTPMALHGPAVSPVVPVSAEGIARATSEPGGMVLLIEPEGADHVGLEQLGALLQRSKHKPEVIVVARNYNPFSFGAALTGLQVNHEKGRGKTFIQALPEPPALADLPQVAAGSVSKRKKGGDIPAPRFAFVGREDELVAMGELLGDGGPILVHGPSGVGKTWLVEHALAASELTRQPDLVLGWGAGFDTFTARLAAVCAVNGDESLMQLLKGEHTPTSVVEATVAALSSDALAGQVMVVHHLEHGLGRDGDFFRKSRLELLLEALLTHTYAMRLVFVSTRTPVFHREGQGAALRTLALGGIKGRFLHELFESYKANELARDKFGPISDRTHGHPMAARTFAVATRVRQDGDTLADNPKFMKSEGIADLTQVKKHLGKRVEKLSKELRRALSVMAHHRYPIDAPEMAAVGLNRKLRLELLSLGLLDMVGTENDRKYGVHPMVRRHLSFREISDFQLLAEIAETHQALARRLEGVAQLAAQQEQTRCAISGRALRLRAGISMPDQDQWLESCMGMMRAKQPRFDLVHQRLAEALKADPGNSDAWLLRLELLQRDNGKNDEVDAVVSQALEAAPVPEVIQTAAGVWMARRARNKAIAVLEHGLTVFPNEARIKTRLASLLLRVGRRPEGIELLEQAMTLEPMLPDPYGLLGQARRDEGTGALGDAEQLLREAVRLAPEDPVQVGRLVDLLMARARVEPDNAELLRASAKEMLSEALKGDRRAPDAHLLLAVLVRESGGDPERADWLLKKARKHTDRNHERWRRISIERALLDMTQGKVDAAENAVRQQIAKDPSNPGAFAALGLILEARQQYVPAHAEYLRAKERTAQNTLECRFYDTTLLRVQGIIEAQAAGLWQQAENVAAAAPAHADTAPRIIRRTREEDEATPTSAPPAAAPEGVASAPAQAAAPAVDALLGSPEVAAPADDAAPAAAEAAPVAVEAPPVAAEAPPVAAEAPPVAVEAAPVAVEAAPEAVEAAPAAVDAAPEAVEAPPVAVEAARETVEAAPAAAEAAPEAVEAAPEAVEAAPVVEDAVEDAPTDERPAEA